MSENNGMEKSGSFAYYSALQAASETLKETYNQLLASRHGLDAKQRTELAYSVIQFGVEGRGLNHALQSLITWLGEQLSVTWQNAHSIFEQIEDALEVAHAKRIAENKDVLSLNAQIESMRSIAADYFLLIIKKNLVGKDLAAQFDYIN